MTSMPMQAPSPASATIYARTRHTVQRLEVHEDLIVLVRRGVKTMSEGGKSTIAAAGSLLVVERGTVGEFTNQPDSRGSYEALALQFPLELVQEVSLPADTEGALSGSACIRPDAELAGAIERAHLSLTDPKASARLRWLRATEVLELLRQAGVRFAPKRLSTRDRVWRLLSSDPAHAWALGNVAETLAMSPSTLRRQLARHGETFTDMLRGARLECALGLLQTTDRPVTAIAGDVGFQSASKFSAAFKARFGFLPSLLRSGSSAAEHKLSAPG
jgi:AraC-like DNA-binding protein